MVGLPKVEITDCNKISEFCLKMIIFIAHHTYNLKTFSSFVFEISNKILLGALGNWLSI